MNVGALTDEQKRAYLDHWGCRCPFCGSQDLTVGDIDPDSLGDGGYRQCMHCDSCGKKWQDCYDLVDVLEVDVEVNESIFTDEIKGLEHLAKRVENDIKDLLGVSCKVRLVEPKTIQRSEGKAKRVVDNRKI